MPSINQPSKDQVRIYMRERQKAQLPPPSPERVRELLGWGLIEAARGKK